MSALETYLLSPQSMWAGATPSRFPLALIDLDSARDWPEQPVLPPVPVIGFGSRDHPLARHLDCVAEAPARLEALVARVLAAPRAAGALADLLRILPGLSLADGLIAESLAYGLLQGSAEHAGWLARRGSAASTPAGRLHGERDGDCLNLRIERPPGNAIDTALRDALAEAFTLAALDRSIARVRLSATGRAFSLGADLAEFGTTRDAASAHLIRRATLPARALAAMGEKLEVHIGGACVGAGLEMATFARRITATSRAWFQLPELAMGLLPGAGGCVSLTRRIGRGRTALMVLSGARISARVALEWGLVDAIVDDAPGDDGGADIV